MSNELPSIFGYTDYRKFLADYYEARKAGVRGYSHRQFSKKAGFSSPNVLKHAIEGTRNIGPEAIEQFIIGLDLRDKMAEYFRILVLLNQASNDADRQKYFKKLEKCIPLAQRVLLQSDAMEYIKNWLYPVIRELSHNADFRDDPYWIKRRLTSDVDLKEIAAALAFLKEKGFIAKNAEGKWAERDHAVVVSSDELRRLAIRNYYRGTIRQAAEILEHIPSEERIYQALILNTPEEHVPTLKTKISEFMADLHVWHSSLPPAEDGTVFQILLQLYPQTKSTSQSTP